MQTLEPILAEIPLFKGMKHEHIELITGCARNVRFDPGDYVGRQGDPADKFWIVRQGLIALEIHGPGRGTLTLQTVRENEVLGWSWLVPPHQWHFDARALNATRALELDGRCLRGKFEHDHMFGQELITRFSQLIVQRLEAMSLQLLDVYGDHE